MSSGEEWSTQGRRRQRRSGRSSSQSGGEPGGGKALGKQPSLADWCANNQLHSKLVELVSKGKAKKSVVDLLKLYQGRGLVISSSAKTALKGSLHGLGDWAEKAAVAPHRSTPAKAKAASSGDAKGSRAAATVAAGAGVSQAHAALRQQCLEQKRELAALKASAKQDKARGGMADAGNPADDPMAAKAWDCSACGADHTRGAKLACRICAHPRAAASPQACAPPARSPEEVAAERVALLRKKEDLRAFGLTPATLASAVKEVDAQLRRLDEPAAVAMDPYALLEQAKVAQDKAALVHEGLHIKYTEIVQRIAALQRDERAAERALHNAMQVMELSKTALTAATAALPAAEARAQAAADTPVAARRVPIYASTQVSRSPFSL